MIRGQSGHIAQQFEMIFAAMVRPHYSNKALFVIDKAPGVWRQVADPKVSDPSDKGIVPAIFSGGKIFLVYDVAVNAEFEVAGLTWKAEETGVAADITAAIRVAVANPPTLFDTAAAEGAGETPPVKPRRRRGEATGPAASPLPTLPLTEPDGSPREGSIIAPVALDYARREAEGYTPPTPESPADPPAAPAAEVAPVLAPPPEFDPNEVEL